MSQTARIAFSVARSSRGSVMLPARDASSLSQKPSPSYDRQMTYMRKDQCIIVDPSDRVLGYASKKDCHLRESPWINDARPQDSVTDLLPPLHRAFSLFLFTPSTPPQLLLQQRSQAKLTYPRLWSNTCCSHPLANYQQELDENGSLGVKLAAFRKSEMASLQKNQPANSSSGDCSSQSTTTTTANSLPLLNNLWRQLDRIEETIPDKTSKALLEGTGIRLDSSDPRLVRLLALGAQQFVADVVGDAMRHKRLVGGQPTGLLKTGSVSVSTTNNLLSPPPVPLDNVSFTASNPATPTKTNTSSNNTSNRNQTTPTTGGGGSSSSDRRKVLTVDDLRGALGDRDVKIARPFYYR